MNAEDTVRIVNRLFVVIDPIVGYDFDRLYEIVEQLKQTDGESWAVGEMLKRAIVFLDLEAAGD